ncbi:low temperature requirement protein A [Actinopolymorpha pittospori]
MTVLTAKSGEDRHASWLELFYDLVAVAGVAQLAHLLHGSGSLGDVGLYVVCFLAFWTAWMCFTVYGNVAGGAARTMPVLGAMCGLVVMAASVGGIHGARSKAFALAYVAVRALSDRVWRDRDRIRVVVDWPVAQIGVGTLPWLVSLWAQPPVRYWLWTLGVVLDLLITFTFAGDRAASAVRRRMERTPPGRQSGRRQPTVGSPVRLDAVHFGERLGLFTIIVLGEGVLMVTEAMSDVEDWRAPLYLTVVGALALLAGLWAQALRRGFGGIPFLAIQALPPRLLLPLHCLTAGVLAALASGLGEAVASVPVGHVEAATRWLLGGCVVAFSLIGVGCALAAGRHRFRAIGIALPGVVLPVLIAAFGQGLTTTGVVWPLAVVVVLAGAL